MSIKRIFTAVLIIAIISSFFVLPAYGEGQNLIKNAGFETQTNGVLSDWTIGKISSGVTSGVISTDAKSGSKSFKITHSKTANTLVTQNINVEQNKLYKVSFWVKTENISNPKASASVTLYYGDNSAGCKGILELMNSDSNWQKVDAFIQTLKDVNIPLTVALRLGGQGTDTAGTAYFDDISIQLVDKLPTGTKMSSFYVPASNVNTNTNNNSASGTSNSKPMDLKIPLFIILGIAALGLLIFVELKLSKRAKSNAIETEDKSNDDEDDDGDDQK